MHHLPIRTVLVAVLTNLLAAGTSFSQEAKPMIHVSPPPGEVAWSVSYTYGKTREAVVEGKSADLSAKSLELTDLARPQKSTYVIKKPVSMRTTTFEDGRKEEGYQYENHEFQMTSRGKEVMMVDLASYPSAEQLFTVKFPGVHWVTPKLFVKIEEAHGESCAYFREGASAKPDPEKMDEVLDASRFGVREAWFSIRTGLPVAFKSGDATGRFTFDAPASAKVDLPGEVRAKIGEFAAYAAYLKQRAAPESTGSPR